MAIYIKSTILMLKKLSYYVRNSIFVYTEHAKFQKASFNSNWDVKQWNKIFLDQYLHLTKYILVL